MEIVAVAHLLRQVVELHLTLIFGVQEVRLQEFRI